MTQRCRESMKALWGLATWWYEQQLITQTFWTAGILDEVKGDILEARLIAFVMSYLDDDVKKGDKEKMGAVEQESLPPGPLPPQKQPTPPPLLLPLAKEAKQLPLAKIEMQGRQQKVKGVEIFGFGG